MNNKILERFIFHEINRNYYLKLRITRLKYLQKIKDHELENIYKKYWHLKFLLYIILILFCIYIINILR